VGTIGWKVERAAPEFCVGDLVPQRKIEGDGEEGEAKVKGQSELTCLAHTWSENQGCEVDEYVD